MSTRRAVCAIILFHASTAIADDVYTRLHVCVAADKSVIMNATGADATTYEAAVRADARFNCMKPPAQRFASDAPTLPTAHDIVTVRYLNSSDPNHKGAGDLSAVAFQKVEVFADGVQVADVDVEQLAFELRIHMSALQSYANGTVIAIHVTRTGGVDPVHFLFKKVFSPYGVGEKPWYAWVPLGLVSTNFNLGPNGLVLAALPINVAVGGRLFLYRGFYLGLSGFLGWMIYANGTAAAASTDNTAGQSTVVNTLTAGVLLDISNDVFLGYAYGWDFREKTKGPESMLVLGLGPGLLQFLKSKL